MLESYFCLCQLLNYNNVAFNEDIMFQLHVYTLGQTYKCAVEIMKPFL